MVGVVADMRRQRLDEPAIPYMFQPGVVPAMDIAVRTAGDPERWRDSDPRRDARLDPMVPPYGIVTVEQRLGRTVALRRLQTMLLLALAAVALTLAMIGAYGVIHQSVVARTQEIGIRMALGASARAVQRMVLAGGLAPGRRGLALGLLGSLALSRTLSTFLYETSALDPADLRERSPAAAGRHRHRLLRRRRPRRALRSDARLAESVIRRGSRTR